MHCAFLPRFNPNLDFLQAVKVTKSGHHLLHDRASKGYGSVLGLTSQTSLHVWLQRRTTFYAKSPTLTWPGRGLRLLADKTKKNKIY